MLWGDFSNIQIQPHFDPIALFLQTFLLSSFVLNQTKHMMTGNTLPRVIRDDVRNIKIPLLPHPTQDRVAEIMEEAYKQRKEMLKEAEDLLAGINDYVLDKLGIEIPEVEEKKSFVVTLRDLKEGKRHDVFFYQPKFMEIEKVLKEGDKRGAFELKGLGDYIKEIKYGASVKNDYVDADIGIPFLRIQNIKEGELDLIGLQYLNPKLKKDIGNCYAKEGDILISRSGTIGSTAYVTKEANGFAYGSYMIKFRLKEEINSEFISILLNTLIGKIQTEQKAIGAVQKNITIPAIKSIKIPIPPTEIQEEIAEEVKRRRDRGKELKNAAEEVIKLAKDKAEKMILGAEID